VIISVDDGHDRRRVLQDASLDVSQAEGGFVVRMIVFGDIRRRVGVVRLIHERAGWQRETCCHDRSCRNRSGARGARRRDRCIQLAELQTLQGRREAADAYRRTRRSEETCAMRLQRVVAGGKRVDREISRRIGDGLGHHHGTERRHHGARDRAAVVVTHDTGDAATHSMNGLVLDGLGQGAGRARTSSHTDHGSHCQHPDAKREAFHLPSSVHRSSLRL
jgi:hypothetical protein